VQGLVDSARRELPNACLGTRLTHCARPSSWIPATRMCVSCCNGPAGARIRKQRRKDLLDLTDQIHGALRRKIFPPPTPSVEVGLGSFPNEPTLQRLKSIAEKAERYR